MNETYAEAGCRRLNNTKIMLKKAGCIAAVVLLFLLGILMMNSLILFVGVVGIVLLVLFLPNFNVEYEYVYVDGQIDFDRIAAKSRRKTLLRIQMEQVEQVAPAGSHALDSYQHIRDIKVKDFSSGDPNAKVYEMIHREGEKTTKIRFEPSEKMLSCMKMKAPRKIAAY